jgi:hypothetical protein
MATQSNFYTENSKVWEQVYTMACGDQFDDSVDGLAEFLEWTPERAIGQRIKHLFHDLKERAKYVRRLWLRAFQSTYREAAEY